MTDSKELTWQAKAAANILEARARKGRPSTRKSNNNCKTCKARHLKCDLTRPFCRRCHDSGRECGGYTEVPLPRLNKNSNSLVGIQLSQSLGLENGDRRVFQYFLSFTAPRLGGVFDKDFWCGDVLQIAHSEPVIRDAILSMSLLYEHPQFLVSFHNRTTASAHEDLAPGSWLRSDMRSVASDDSGYSEARPTVARPKIDQHHALALKYYNRAMSSFREQVNSGQASPMLALLSCVLFIAIETMRDNTFAALALFKSGASLLRQLSLKDLGHKGSLLNNLKQRLRRLGLLAALSGHAEQLDSEDEVIDHKVRPFETLAEARDSLYRLLFDVHAFINDAEYRADLLPKLTHTDSPNDAKAWSFSTEMTRGKSSAPISPREEPEDGITRLYYGCQDAATPTRPGGSIVYVHPTFLPYAPSDDLLQRQDENKARMQIWYEGYLRLDDADTDAGRLLLIHYLAYSIWLSARLDPMETVYDQHRSKFEQMLEIAEQYLSCRPERQTYSFESEVLAPLYLVAARCRVPSLRRRALDLIDRAPRKECTFGASSIIEIISRLIAIEEAGLYPHDSSILSRYFNDEILPPDSARIRGFEIIVNRPLGRHELRVTRYARQDNGCWIKSIDDFPV